MAIRYDKELNREINRIVKNFNQKIVRLEKQERELLPDTVSIKELKKSVTSRNELKRKLKELQRFSKRGAEEIITTKGGLTLTRYDIDRIKRENARAKRLISREIRMYETTKPKVLGKEQTTTFAKMGSINYLNTVARRKALEKNIEKIDKTELENLKKLIGKTLKNYNYMNEQFKENYFKMLSDLAYYTDYDKEKIRKLKDKLFMLEPKKFYELFKNEKAIQDIIYYYPILTGKAGLMNPDIIKNDVEILYDNLIDNIDEILKDYM